MDVEVYRRRIHCFILCNWSWKFIRDVYTVSYFVAGRIQGFILWKFIRDVYTVSYFVRWMYWKFIGDVYTVSYFVTGVGSL